MDHVLYARQPIFDRKLEVAGYELLFRKDDDDVANFFDGDHATARVLVNAFTETKSSDILGGKPAFINLTDNLIRSGIVHMLPKQRAVLEILEDVHVDETLIREVKRLAEAGYKIALDDFVWTPKMRPLVRLAAYIKLDILNMSPDDVRRNLAVLRPYKATLVAEKVETKAEFDLCMEQGFDLFQGYFLAKPHKVSGRRVPANRASMLHLLSRVYDPKLSIRELNRLISRDVGLSYRFLKIVNSAYYNLPRKVESIQHALSLLGLDFTRMWISLIALAAIDDKPQEVFVTAAIRAKMCELLGKKNGAKRVDSYYVVGLFSILDALMDAPLMEIVRDLPLDDDIMSALVDRTGPIGSALDCVVAHEQCRWGDVEFEGLDSGAIQQAYLEALAWASETKKTVAA